MGGIQDEAVFSSMEKVNQYLESRGSEGSPKVVEAQVRGELEEPNKVFTASWYDRPLDIHNFQGIYGSYEEAKKAAGERGLVLNRGIDDRLG